MMGLSFAAPLALLGLLALPAIYLLLRVSPPPPREIVFPAVRLLRDLSREKETPAKTPWPLLLLRLLIAAFVALALSGPLWTPAGGALGVNGSLLIVLDDSWAAAPTWERRVAIANALIDSAQRAGAPVALSLTSQGALAPQFVEATRAVEQLRSVRPKPYLPDRREILGPFENFVKTQRPAHIAWIADGLEESEAPAFGAALQAAARAGASIEIYTADRATLALRAPNNDAKALEVEALRTASGPPQRVEAVDAKGRLVANAEVDFSGGLVGKSRFDLPIDVRNDVTLLRIAGEASAGAVALVDPRGRVRRVAIVEGAGADEAQPLLSATHYLEKALAPFAEIRTPRANEPDPLAAALRERPNVLVLADVGEVTGNSLDAITHFVEDGGILLRFAGPRLANAADDLIPVRLRRLGRVLGGAMSWETPKKLAAFEPGSPFFGLAPSPEVTVTRQVLAEPEPGLTEKTWARLADGTPLVTAERRGKGQIVLFHVSAETSWSNLPISGLFVDMLQRICAMSGESASAGPQGEAGVSQAILPALQTLDGFGALGAPPATAQPIASDYTGRAGPEHPPGFYGAANAFVALAALTPEDGLKAMDYAPLGFRIRGLETRAPTELKPFLLSLIFIGLLVDGVAMLRLAGALRLRAATLVVAGFASLVIFAPHDGRAAEPTKSDRTAALTARLAFVVSGDKRIDDISRMGLELLSRVLTQRTSFSPGDPVGVNPARDELAFYPMLYWPIVATAPQPSPATLGKVAAYMKQGGTIVFDTRDALTSRPGDTPPPETAWFRQMARGLDIPELEIVPRDHVITKTFYLLDGFVGRYNNGEAWVEAQAPEAAEGAARPVRVTDGVSAIVIVSNDLASAWAQDQNGAPVVPLVPGGARQREMALRGGVNLVMYTLTGNYKSDQVHVRDLLRRLGQ